MKKIGYNAKCELIETKEARGVSEKFSDRILEIEAQGFEKHIKDDYIICLSDRGKEMKSNEFARYIERIASQSGRVITFIVGGFLGLEKRILSRADHIISLSRMTFSHELSRIMLLEQIYRALSIIHGRQYAK